MAKRLLARTVIPCKHYSDIDDEASEAGFEAGTLNCDPVADSVDRNIRRPIATRVFDGMPYVVGLGPVMKVSEIPDMPDVFKEQMTAAARERSRSLSNPSSDLALTILDASSSDPQNAGDLSNAAPSSLIGHMPTTGPVFSANEIAMARRIMLHLECAGELCIPDCDMSLEPSRADAPGDAGMVDLCRRLAVLRLISIAQTPRGVILRSRNATRLPFRR